MKSIYCKTKVLPNLTANYNVVINLGSCCVSVYTVPDLPSLPLSQDNAWVWGSIIKGILFCKAIIWLF